VGDDGFSADPYVEQRAVADTAALEPIIDEVLSANAANVEAYRAGKTGLLGFFVGQVMKATNGQADARVVNELVRKKLEA
jgi:Asp-tRNA(Asn)/Glu-tRNA(Gln) amidotransferase B subunit